VALNTALNTAQSTPWRVHGVLPRTAANGPGIRFAVWSQGCTLACPGCFNPRTHRADGAERTVPVGSVVDAVLAELPHLDGVTLTGGEPLEQPGAVAAFCADIKARTGLGIVVLTGFTRAEIESDPIRAAAVADVDMVIAGRYNARLHLGAGLRGSANKTYWARTPRYRPDDFAADPNLEVTIGVDASVTVTGMEPAGDLIE
jgi:anaerobic ribonucleoside-triphosphate reductase activating protein